MSEVSTGGGYGGLRRRRRKPRKIKRPSATQRARAQERQYRSQGRAVERRAREQRRESGRQRPAPQARPGPYTDRERKKVKRHKRTKQYQRAIQKARVKGPTRSRGRSLSEGATGKSDEAFRRGQEYVRKKYVEAYGESRTREGERERGYKTTVPPDVAARAKYRRDVEKTKRRNVEKMAPVIDVLEETTRPLHAVAGAERSLIKSVKKGEGIEKAATKALKAAARGAQNKDKSTFSDVLGDLGVPKGPVRSVAGFAGDVVGDPLTYLGLGVGSVGARQGVKLAGKAAKGAKPTPKRTPTTKKEATRAKQREHGGGADQPTLAERARRRGERGDQRRGATVRLGGKEVPGGRKITAKAAEPIRRAGRTRPAQAVKGAAREVRPTLTPTGVKRGEYQELRRAIRTTRAGEHRGRRVAQARAHAFQRAVGKKNYERVIDAIEAGTTKALPADLRQAAKRFQDDMKYARRLSRRAGVKVPERKNYVPHQRTAKSLKEERKAMIRESVGQRRILPGSSKARTEERSLKELREQEPDKYSQKLPEIYAARMDEATTSAARADLNRRMADIGRTLKRGEDPQLRPGESIYQIRGSDLSSPMKTLPPKASGRFVVLNDDLIKATVQGLAKPGGGQIARGYDVATGWWKFLATVPNPGFHIRNLVGDTQNAFMLENAVKLMRNLGTSGRGLKALSAEEARRGMSLTPKSVKAGTVKIQGQRISVLDLAKEAERTGAIRTGFIARELPELQTALQTAAKPHKVKARVGKVDVARWIQNREDLVRLATYIGGRKRGLSPERATERAMRPHFDYADLTSLERNVFRRIAPFYTFSARNIPFQFQSFFERPGKFAQYQKIREEFAKAFGVDLEQVESDITEYEQRTAPIPFTHKGKTFTVSMGASGLPLTDLNEMPVSANPIKTAEEWLGKAFSMLNPAIKSPIEVWANFSFFFRDELERSTGPYVAAPEFVSKLPKGLREKLKIVSDYRDPRTGEQTWGWPAKVDYFASILPGPAGAVERGFTKSSQSGVSKGVAYGTGVRIRKVDALSTRIGKMFDEKADLDKKAAALRQRAHPKNGKRIDADNPTKEYTRLLERGRELDKKIEGLRIKRGDIKRKKKGFDFGKSTKEFNFEAGQKEFNFGD